MKYIIHRIGIVFMIIITTLNPLMIEPVTYMKYLLKVLAIILWLSVTVLLVAETELPVGDLFYLFLF